MEMSILFLPKYLRPISYYDPHLNVYSILTHQQQTAFENIVGKEEIAHNKQFLHFLQCFLLGQKIVSPFVHIFDIISLFAVNWKSPKLQYEVKG